MRKNALILLAGLFGAAGVAARAFEAHGLIALSDMSEPRLRDFSSGTEMILIHALTLLGVAAIVDLKPRISILAGAAFGLGVVLFAAPLLTYGLTGSRALIFLSPFGGALLIAGWVSLAVCGWIGLITRAKSP